MSNPNPNPNQMSVKLPDTRTKSGAVNAALRGLEGYEVQDVPFMGSPPPPRFPEGATPGSEQAAAALGLQPMFPDDAEVLFPPQDYVQDAYEQEAFPQETSGEQRLRTGAHGNVSLSNAYLELNFSKASGLLLSVVNKEAGLSLAVGQHFCAYKSGFGSGAYIFRPEGTTCEPVETKPGGGAAITAVIKGGVVHEVRQRFSDWLTQTVRLGVGWRHAEFEHTVGPLPLKGMFPAGKEVVTRFVAPG